MRIEYRLCREQRRSDAKLADLGEFGPNLHFGCGKVDFAGIQVPDRRKDDVGLRSVQLAEVDGHDPAGAVDERAV